MRKRTILLIVSLVLTLSIWVTPALAETVYLDPSESSFDVGEVSVGHRFNVTAWVSNVSDLMGFQVALYYNASVINMTSASLAADHVLAGQAGIPLGPLINYTDSLGYGFVGFSGLGGMTTPFTGNGTLAVFEFEITTVPEVGNLTSPLIISYKVEGGTYETKLKNSTGGAISFTGTDGSYIIIPEFLSFLILPMFSVLTLVALVLAKKLQRKLRFE
ncbi:MAG: hypothetical protein O2V44_07185 [Candidatus Bathyarchaeota archaeon]|nr:hypothetical protein [Candidatus Bathyarchaeota archaeon]